MDAKEEIKALDCEKKKVEEQLSKEWEVLNANGVDLKESLVLPDGCPRSDIDVYSVRNARHKIICLQNDHRDLLNKIESKLHEIHANARLNSEGNLTEEVSPYVSLSPFAKINKVDMGSPAFIDGLKVNDLVCRFGTITSENFKGVSDVGEIVNSSINKQLKVVVKREKNELVYLTPRRWNGKGLLGCNIIPYEVAER